MSFGKVTIRLRAEEDNEGRKRQRIVDGELLHFVTIPVKFETEEEHRVIVYGIVETDDGRFAARQLSELRRKKNA